MTLKLHFGSPRLSERSALLKELSASLGTLFGWLKLYCQESRHTRSNPTYHSLTRFTMLQQVIAELDSLYVDLYGTEESRDDQHVVWRLSSPTAAVLSDLRYICAGALLKSSPDAIRAVFARAESNMKASQIHRLVRHEDGAVEFSWEGRLTCKRTGTGLHQMLHSSCNPTTVYLRALVRGATAFAEREKAIHLAWLKLNVEDLLMIELQRLRELAVTVEAIE